ncbi:serine hydrolase domain-containing protein [Streptomyces sp. ITFR-16]|uniref:serine hydrolase domain-containing protein n=1 Tax=Streptomyces sp. ITFR-16 TaxID=3075198 RepID=UPI00288AAE2B|nr:serine hydrolase domain-containing protein [Streptomyces sp. ITFR-16]WNI21534.1 serine hydrolase domain-containing protein [Streptomyces sp. ITFR-16]
MAGEAAVSGWVAPGWEAVREAFARGQSDDPGGAQLAVHHRGRPVVDLASAGEGATAAPGAFGAASVGVLMSVTKGLVAVCAHLLSERGVLDLDAPVARYWPEFAAAGKSATTVSDLLTHRAGLPAFGLDVSGPGPDGLRDWDLRVAELAAARPLWEPGTAFLYHSLTFGHLVGEVIRRASGMSVGAFFATEVAGPLGLDLWIGLPRDEEHRFVPQFSVRPAPSPEQIAGFLTGLGLAPDDPLHTGLRAAAAELADATDGLTTRQGRAAELPGAGGIGNARSLSRLYAALIGPVDGVRLLSPLTVERARAPRNDHLAPPPPLDSGDASDRSRFGLGFELPRAGLPLLGEGSFGHAGAGGRLGAAHPESGLAVGYVCTAMAWEPSAGPDPRWTAWTRTVVAAADAPGRGRD